MPSTQVGGAGVKHEIAACHPLYVTDPSLENVIVKQPVLEVITPGLAVPPAV
jgi:hypothetical protein